MPGTSSRRLRYTLRKHPNRTQETGSKIHPEILTTLIRQVLLIIPDPSFPSILHSWLPSGLHNSVFKNAIPYRLCPTRVLPPEHGHWYPSPLSYHHLKSCSSFHSCHMDFVAIERHLGAFALQTGSPLLLLLQYRLFIASSETPPPS